MRSATRAAIPMLALALAVLGAGAGAADTGPGAGAYYGKEVGPLSELHHGVRGRLYVVDSRTLYLHDFHYDGEGPAAYFYVGDSKAVGAGGARLRDERGGAGPLRRYRGAGLVLALPDGRTLRDVRWLSVWCDDFSVNFGSVVIPRALEPPRPVRLAALRGAHGVSSDPVLVVDAQTLLVPNFSYDGEAPDAKFWVGRGEAPSAQGIRIPDENGKEAPLRKYDRKTVVLTLPGELTVFDIGHLAVWCEAFTVNFGHVTLPRARLAAVPPSLKMLGVSPQSRNKELAGAGARAGEEPRARRPPLAPQAATTYRPPLRLRPGAAPPGDSPPHPSSLRRRADSHSPSAEQLLRHDQPLKHSSRDEDEKPPSPQDYEPRLQQDYEQQQKLLQDNQQQNTQTALLNQQKDVFQQQQIQNQQYLTQISQPSQLHQLQRLQQLQQQQLEYYQQLLQKPVYQQSSIIQPQYQVQNDNFQQHRSQELYYPEQSTEAVYQGPQYVSQQRAYEEALLNQQYQQIPQYRLVPYGRP